MTTSKSPALNVVVVDGSNIATEGRSTPSLSQLNDAVLAFREEYPDATVTVVVDATFGHRIEKSELAEFDAAVAHNEVVAPPAGAIGRGDAFVLSIANKVGARILSNDSFQEFHGTYTWLFDEGRLIGGKPVPYVGWVFVERLPVKGPTSRKSQRDARSPRAPRESQGSRRTASKEASQPMPVPTAPPPGPRRSSQRRGPAAAATTEAPPAVSAATAAAAPSRSSVNELLPFLEFVEHHPVGSSVNGVVESYSSHGAYVSVGDLRGYVPLRLMSDPPPRSAREVMRVGDAVTLVVTSFAPARRSVDLAVPPLATDLVVAVPAEPGTDGPPLDHPAPAPAKRAGRKRAATEQPAADAAPVRKRAAKKVAPAADQPITVDTAPPKKRAAKKQAPPMEQPAEPAAVPKATKAKTKTAAKKAPAKKSVATKMSVAAKKSVTKKSPAEPAAAPTSRRSGGRKSVSKAAN